MKITKIMSLVFVLLLISAILLAGCAKETSKKSELVDGTVPAAPGSEEKEISQGLDELDDLEQMEKDMNDISLDELENISLE